MILYDQENRVFTLQTRNTTYQLKADTHGVLLHTYFGPRVEPFDLSRLIRGADRGFSPNPGDLRGDRTYSLDCLPQELSCAGGGDFRLPALEVELPDGSHGLDLRYAGHEIRPGKYALPGLPAFFGGEDEAQTLVVRLEDKWAGVAAELLYGVFPERDLITRAVRVSNTGGSLVKLLRCASLCLDFQRSDLDLITFNGRHTMERAPERTPLRYGVQSVGSVRGMSSHQHNPFVVLCEHNTTEEQGLAYGAMLLYSGNFEAAVERSQFEDTRLTLGIHPFHFQWNLGPGESFTSPEAALVCSEDGLGGMSRSFHRAIREHLLRDPWGQRRKPVLVNSWEAAYTDFDEAKLLSLARESALLGVELFVLDDGWFGHRDDDTSSLGDWFPCLRKLPEGLAGLAGKLRELGLDFGLWIEPEMVSEDSELYAAHPDWALGPAGLSPIRGRDQLVLDMGRREVRDYILGSLERAMEGVDIRYIKWDMNRCLTQVWTASLPPERQGEVYHRYVLGVYDLLERFRQAHPGLLIEGCAGGGGRFDAGMLYYTPQIWCSDNTDALDRVRIQYGTSFAYPPVTMGAHVSDVPNAQTGRVTPLSTRGAVALAGTFGFELDLRRLTEPEKDEIRSQIAAYKQSWPLLSDGDYYRLTPPTPDGPPAAWAMVSRDRREALVTVVSGQIHAAGPFRTVKISGLDPALQYRVNGSDLWPGDVLMRAGYPLPMLREYESLRLWLRAE